MNRYEMWEKVRRANPAIESGKVEMSAGNFKKAMFYAYDKGRMAASDSAGNFFDDFLKGGFKR